ncbi:MAG: hypothetical protein Q9180_000445 [Flavoplaca navasiana]
MQLVDWLDDLCVRFIINLPQEELESVERICFQVEEAQWYYEDFIRPLDPDLPSLNLRNFCLRIFQHCPLLSEFSPYHHATAFEEFLAYKTRVPVRGAIMLNQAMDQVILVKGWKKGANWSFPRGKINKDESDLACAIREVYEETGYDVEAAGLVGPQADMKYIDVAIQHQHIRLYVFPGVSMDTQFEAKTRKEISKIDWWKLSDLPTLKKKKQHQEGRGEDLALNANKFYMVAPFLVPLKKWISQQKRLMKSDSVDQVLHPTEDENEQLPLDVDGVKGDRGNSTSEEMNRLLAGLRQPPQEPNPQRVPSFITTSSADEASWQLKTLLHVSTEQSTEVNAPSPAQESEASTLLALLRGKKPKTQHVEPQTPLELVTDSSAVPESPKPQHMMKPRLAALPRPPVFQIDRNRDEQKSINQSIMPNTTVPKTLAPQDQQASIMAWKSFETVSAEQEAERKRLLSEKQANQLAREEQTGVRNKPRLPVMSETWRQVKVHDVSSMRQARQRQVVNILERPVGGLAESQDVTEYRQAQQRSAFDSASQPIAAPYQVTSNVEPSDKSQYQDIYRPTIPAANKLPMPKLTSHSSSLLDLFKKGPSRKDRSVLESVPGSSTPAIRLPTDRNAMADSEIREELPNVSGDRRTSELFSAPASTPQSAIQKTSDSKMPQSAHQASLLELFRRPLVPADATTQPSQVTLDVPMDIVELSAMPSPSRSKHIAKSDSDGRQRKSSMQIGEPNHPRKKIVNHSNPPVSATVNGPLNVPQFEMIARRADTSSIRKLSPVREVKKSPVTILARPSTAKAYEQIGLPESIIRDSQYAKAPVPPPAGLNGNNNQPRNFQPKILRRPPPSAENPTIPPPGSAQSSTHLSNGELDPASPLASSDHHSTMKREHKTTLLSLFTNTKSLPSPSSQSISRPDFSAFVSPIATKPPNSFPLLSERLNSNVNAAISSPGEGMLPPSYKGPEALPSSVETSRINSWERQTPLKKVTNDVDRNFLLGYLDGVAKKEGR